MKQQIPFWLDLLNTQTLAVVMVVTLFALLVYWLYTIVMPYLKRRSEIALDKEDTQVKLTKMLTETIPAQKEDLSVQSAQMTELMGAIDKQFELANKSLRWLDKKLDGIHEDLKQSLEKEKL